MENELKNESDLVDSAMFHADMMSEENAELQNKLNSKRKRKDQDDPTMDVGDVRWLTGPRGQRERAERQRNKRKMMQTRRRQRW